MGAFAIHTIFIRSLCMELNTILRKCCVSPVTHSNHWNAKGDIFGTQSSYLCDERGSPSDFTRKNADSSHQGIIDIYGFLR